MKKINSIVMYIGSYDNDYLDVNEATAAAANQVQSIIFEELKKNQLYFQKVVISFLLKPMRTWPFSSFFWMGATNNLCQTPPYINITGVKQLCFSFYLFLTLFRIYPKVIIKYNTSLLDILVLITYKLFCPNVFLVSVIQDVHYDQYRRFHIPRLLVLFGMKLVKSFDFIIPISNKIKEDFDFPNDKVMVFKGGLTRQGVRLLAEDAKNLMPYAVFAGSLESYNGIDILLKAWTENNIQLDLHVFGRGSCENLVRQAAVHNSRIIFHGFKNENDVFDYQKKALINLCFRFSKGIEAGYFFPSKLFNIICAPGVVLVNKFVDFPEELVSCCAIIDDDFSNLMEKIKSAFDNKSLIQMRSTRRKWIELNGDWATVINEIYLRAGLR